MIIYASNIKYIFDCFTEMSSNESCSLLYFSWFIILILNNFCFCIVNKCQLLLVQYCHHLLLAGRSSAYQWPADRCQQRIPPQPFQPRRHGNPAALHVHRRERQRNHPAGGSAFYGEIPSTGTPSSRTVPWIHLQTASPQGLWAPVTGLGPPVSQLSPSPAVRWPLNGIVHPDPACSVTFMRMLSELLEISASQSVREIRIGVWNFPFDTLKIYFPCFSLTWVSNLFPCCSCILHINPFTHLIMINLIDPVCFYFALLCLI